MFLSPNAKLSRSAFTAPEKAFETIELFETSGRAFSKKDLTSDEINDF